MKRPQVITRNHDQTAPIFPLTHWGGMAVWLPLVLGALACSLITWRVLALQNSAIDDAKTQVRAVQQAQLREAKEALVARLAWPLRDVHYLATQQTLQRYTAYPSDARRLELNDSLFSLMATRLGIYAQARYLDARGQEVVRVGNRRDGTVMVGSADLQNKSNRYYFQETHALPTGSVYLSRFDLNVEKGEVEKPFVPMLRFAAPVLGADKRPQGVVVVNYLGQSLIDRLRKVAVSSGQPLWLLNGSGHWLMGDNAQDEWGFMFPEGQTRTLATNLPAVWANVHSVQAGQIQLADIAGGLLATAAIEPAVDLNRETHLNMVTQANRWYLVSWVSAEALQTQLAPLVRTYRGYLAGWLLLVLALASTGGWAWRRRLKADLALRHSHAQLQASNRELETFSYTVSHDLRAPLRAIDGYSRILLHSTTRHLDDTDRDYLQRMRAASQRMGGMIDDILALSRLTRTEVERKSLDLSAMSAEIMAQIRSGDPSREAEVRIAPGMRAMADERLVRVALENLLRNAWKFTGNTPDPVITVDCDRTGPVPVFVVQDNGAGFDMAYADKLFAAFQRLHTAKEFAGSGIGLATVQRVVHKHGGRIWAHGEVGQGARFHFTLQA